MRRRSAAVNLWPAMAGVSLLISSGANVKQVSTWAGHSSVTVTLDTCAHLLHDDDDDIADRMDALLSTRAESAEVRQIGG